jgi:hypothetical protein
MPRDPNQLAACIVAISTQEQDEPQTDVSEGKNPAAVSLGRLGGLKGGRARAASLSPEKRAEIAQKAAAARWNKKS